MEAMREYTPWLGDRRQRGALSRILCFLWQLTTEMGVLFILTGLLSGSAYLVFESFLPHFERHLLLIIRVLHDRILLLLGLIHWTPLAAVVYLAHKRNTGFQFKHAGLGIAGFGLLGLVYCFGVYRTEYPPYMNDVTVVGNYSVSLGSHLQAWSTGKMPRLPESCTARVASQQESLFTDPDVYHSQFARTHVVLEGNCTDDGGDSCQGQLRTLVFPAFAPEVSDKVQHDPVLCGQGFEGNADLYGLGVRLGVYFQWGSSLLANSFNLFEHGRALQKTYLVFSIAICLAAIILSTSGACVFAVEIEILYWVYWGGFMCVFATASYSGLALSMRSRTWVKLDWTVAITYVTHWIMAYHGLWFIWHGYDQTLARMPCGTYHAFTGFVLKDPSDAFWVVRDWWTMMFWPFLAVAPLIFPWTALLMLPELHGAIQHSAIFTAIFPDRQRRMARIFLRGWENHGSSATNIFQHFRHDNGGWRAALGHGLMAISRRLRQISTLPDGRRPGIYIASSSDIDDPW